MIRISKQADYGILVLGHFAKEQGERRLSARDLADRTRLSIAMVSKVLKMLTRGGLLESHRGAMGGYVLSRPPEEISVARIIEVCDGPIAVTECAPHASENVCAQEDFCPVRGSWNLLNDVIKGALERVSLAEMTCPVVSIPGAENIVPSDSHAAVPANALVESSNTPS